MATKQKAQKNLLQEISKKLRDLRLSGMSAKEAIAGGRRRNRFIQAGALSSVARANLRLLVYII